MQSNQKYTTVENIVARVSDKIRGKDFNVETFVQWCAECTIEVIGNPLSMMNYKKVKLLVRNAKAELPCNVYRLLDVFNRNDSRITQYENDGDHIIFSSRQPFDTDELGNQCVYVNYLGIAVDPKTGYPYILRGHELACEAYCIKQAHREDYYTGKIAQHVWLDMSNECSIQCGAANNGIRHETNDDMRMTMLQVHNMIPRMSTLPLLHLDGVE